MHNVTTSKGVMIGITMIQFILGARQHACKRGKVYATQTTCLAERCTLSNKLVWDLQSLKRSANDNNDNAPSVGMPDVSVHRQIGLIAGTERATHRNTRHTSCLCHSSTSYTCHTLSHTATNEAIGERQCVHVVVCVNVCGSSLCPLTSCSKETDCLDPRFDRAGIVCRVSHTSVDAGAPRPSKFPVASVHSCWPVRFARQNHKISENLEQ